MHFISLNKYLAMHDVELQELKYTVTERLRVSRKNEISSSIFKLKKKERLAALSVSELSTRRPLAIASHRVYCKYK